MIFLLVVAECGQFFVVEFLIIKVEIKEEKISVYELLGVLFVNDKEYYDVMKVFLFLCEGMYLRYSDFDNIIIKEDYLCVEVYNNRFECKIFGELNVIRYDFEVLYMECLVIRERILGFNNFDVFYFIIFRGVVYADSKQFDRCIAFWLYVMKLRYDNKRLIVKDLLRFF